MNKKFFISIPFLFLCFLLMLWAEHDLVTKEMDSAKEGDSTLVIYSPLNEKIIIPVVKEFQDITGIKVKYLSSGTINLLEELRENKNAIDIVWGSSKEFLELNIDYFEPYQTIHSGHIASYLKQKDHYWTGFNILPIVLMYNKKLVTENDVPHSWEQLLDPKWKGRIAYANPHNSGSSFIILSSLLSLGSNGNNDNWDHVTKLCENLDGSLLNKSSEVYTGIAQGKFEIGLTMEESAIRHIQNGDEVGIVYLDEGTPIIVDSVALMKNASNKESAKIFIDFVLSKYVQQYIVDNFSLRSVRTDVAPPEGVVSINQIHLLDSNCEKLYQNEEATLEMWDSIMANTP